jgi:hypothetical protein
MSVSTSTMLVRIESQICDVDALRQQYELDIHTPKVEDKLRQGCGTIKELSGTIQWRDVVFTLTWPLAYSDTASLCLEVSSAAECDQPTDFSDINKAIDIFSVACEGSHCGCAADIMTYAIDLISDMPSSESGSGSSGDGSGTLCMHVLKYNHLLLGSEHKKERAMVSLAKKSLLGGVCYGTPGLIFLLGADDDTATSYLGDCRSLGKRGEVVFRGVLATATGGSSSSSRWTPEQVAAGRGFLELSTADVQACMGGLGVFKQHVLQMSS